MAHDIPDWVICPKDYEALLAEYAMLRLSDTGKLDLERLTQTIIVTGRMRAADCDVPPVTVEYPHSGIYAEYLQRLFGACSKAKEVWVHPTRPSSLGGTFHLTQKVHEYCLKRAMETAVRVFLTRGALYVAQHIHMDLLRGDVGGILAKYPTHQKRDLPLPTEEVMRWLRTIHPRYRVAPELAWVNWGIVRSLTG